MKPGHGQFTASRSYKRSYKHYIYFILNIGIFYNIGIISMAEHRQNIETELRQCLETKNRTISRLLSEKSSMEKELGEIRIKLGEIKQKLAKLKRNLQSKQEIRFKISIIQNEENEEMEIINIE